MRILGEMVYPYLGERFKVRLEVGHYMNGRISLNLVSQDPDESDFWEPFMSLTVNLPDEECPEGEVWIKAYSENEGADLWAIKNEIIEAGPTSNAQTGYVFFVERFKLTEKVVKAIAEALVSEGSRSRR